MGIDKIQLSLWPNSLYTGYKGTNSRAVTQEDYTNYQELQQMILGSADTGSDTGL